MKPWLELAGKEGHANEREKFERNERIVACVRDGNNRRLSNITRKSVKMEISWKEGSKMSKDFR